MSPNKTLYIRDTDAEVWERADKIAAQRGTSVSQLATDALRTALPQAIAEDDPTMEEIRVKVGDDDEDYVEQVFIGRWLLRYDERPENSSSEDEHHYYGIALTKGGRIAVFRTYYVEEVGSLDIYDSIDDAAGSVPADLLNPVAVALGKPRTLWLDI